jgi:hypothetical protein
MTVVHRETETADDPQFDAGCLSTPDLSDEELLDCVQRQTFRFFWDAAHPVSGLAPDRQTARSGAVDDRMAVGGSGFGIMAIIVAAARGWISRQSALGRIGLIVDFLAQATRFHGIYPHYMDGRTGAPIPMSRKNDGADIVETSYLFMGLLCAREAFDRDSPAEIRLRRQITRLWEEAEWNWHTRGGREVLYWHWSPNDGWAMDHEIRGWNECLITYVLAASSPRYAVDAEVYHRGFASGPDFLNGKSYYGIQLPLGPAYGGPLFFAHYSFCGLDPHGLKDRYADYWEQNLRHVTINREHCLRNPLGHKGYGPACWGLTASDDPKGYDVHAPDHDNGTISPTAALSSFPYTPTESMLALRHFSACSDRLWCRYGFIDAFCEAQNWYADSYLAINQGPIVAMIENYRTGLLWKLFMRIPEIQAGLRKLGFASPHL